MKIIVKDEDEKKELLRMCQYLHDFSIMFRKMRKRSRIEIQRSFDGSIPSERVYPRKYCGVSLDFELFPHLQLLVALVDAEEEFIEKIHKETIIIQEHENQFQFKEPQVQL